MAAFRVKSKPLRSGFDHCKHSTLFSSISQERMKVADESSVKRLCEKPKGAVLPLFVKAIKDRKDNANRRSPRSQNRPSAGSVAAPPVYRQNPITSQNQQLAERKKRRRSARMTHLCSAKVIHTKNRIWRSASACQHHHPRRRRVSLSSGEGESAWRTDVTPGVAFGAGQNGCFCPPPVGHFSRANHGNFSRVPKRLRRVEAVAPQTSLRRTTSTRRLRALVRLVRSFVQLRRLQHLIVGIFSLRQDSAVHRLLARL